MSRTPRSSSKRSRITPSREQSEEAWREEQKTRLCGDFWELRELVQKGKLFAVIDSFNNLPKFHRFLIAEKKDLEELIEPLIALLCSRVKYVPVLLKIEKSEQALSMVSFLTVILKYSIKKDEKELLLNVLRTWFKGDPGRINQGNKASDYLLNMAVKAGSVELVKFLLQFRPNTRIFDDTFNNPVGNLDRWLNEPNYFESAEERDLYTKMQQLISNYERENFTKQELDYMESVGYALDEGEKVPSAPAELFRTEREARAFFVVMFPGVDFPGFGITQQAASSSSAAAGARTDLFGVIIGGASLPSLRPASAKVPAAAAAAVDTSDEDDDEDDEVVRSQPK